MDTQEISIQEQVRTVGKTQCSDCKRCLTDEELAAKGFATEQRPVRLYRDGKPYTEDHPIWYSVVGRERMQQLFFKEEKEELE